MDMILMNIYDFSAFSDIKMVIQSFKKQVNVDG